MELNQLTPAGANCMNSRVFRSCDRHTTGNPGCETQALTCSRSVRSNGLACRCHIDFQKADDLVSFARPPQRVNRGIAFGTKRQDVIPTDSL
jgi:hypothetical protein